MEKSGHNPIPAGYRMASGEFSTPQGKIRAEGLIPADDVFAKEVTRLSRRVTRMQPYGRPIQSDEHGAFVKVRESSVYNGFAETTFREVHDAALPVEQSLIEIQVITMQNGLQMNDEIIYPTEYLMYKPKTHELERFHILTFNESTTQEAVAASFALARRTGESDVTDRDWMVFYTNLLHASGENPPVTIN